MSEETAEPRIERNDLLDAALPQVAFDGWTGEALQVGARDLGIDPRAVRQIFPKGAAQALAFFSRRADARMTAAFEAAETDGLRTHERVILAVELRLHELMPHREAVRRGLSFLALPVNASLGAKLLYRTVDDIFYAVGDRAADFSFYTKRGLLAGVLASTTLYWLEDGSEDFVATHEFLERRIADVMRLYGARHRVEGAGGRFPNPFRIVSDAVEKRYGAGRT